jgi:hypothetical protein
MLEQFVKYMYLHVAAISEQEIRLSVRGTRIH